MPDQKVIDLDDAMRLLDDLHRRRGEEGLGFQRAGLLAGTTYRDQSTVVIIPSRGRLIDFEVISRIYGMIGPMNQARHIMACFGDEVGIAYDRMIKEVLASNLASWKYIMTIEADNLVPADAQKRLLETIEQGMWDAVSGLYFTKGDINMPMAYGDPAKFEATGQLEFGPRDVSAAVMHGQVMPVNGIAMGCALWRMDLFRDIPPPWFVTVDDVVDGKSQAFTQDLWFCKEARARGRRFAVDCRVKVGHKDLATGQVY